MNKDFDPIQPPQKGDSFCFYNPSGKLIILIKLIESWFSKNTKMSDLDYLDICDFVEKVFNYRNGLERKNLEKWEKISKLYNKIKLEELEQ